MKKRSEDSNGGEKLENFDEELVQNIVMDEELVQHVAMDENMLKKNFVMGADIDPKFEIDLSIFKIGGWKFLQPRNRLLLEESI